MYFIELWFNRQVKIKKHGGYCNHERYIFHNIIDAIKTLNTFKSLKHLKSIELDHVYPTGTGAWIHETIIKGAIK